MKITLGNREFDIQNGMLDLAKKNITQEELTALCDILKTDKRITYLDLSGNNIGETGAKAIAEALKVNHTLTALYLSENNIGETGAKAIAEALKVNHTLTVLDLSENKIGNEGAKAIAEALKVNNTLTALYLYGDDLRIGADGIKALDGLVIKNTNLLFCDYAGASTAAQKELAVRYAEFTDFVSSLAKNEPYTGAISEIQFHWLKNHGRDFYNSISEKNKISYEQFEAKWQTILDDKSYTKFKIKFNLVELDPVMLQSISTVNQHMITKTEPIKFEMPDEIIRNMFNQLTLQEKIDQLSR